MGTDLTGKEIDLHRLFDQQQTGLPNLRQSGFGVKVGIENNFFNFRKHFAVLKRYKSESRRKGGCHDRRAIYRVSDRAA